MQGRAVFYRAGKREKSRGVGLRRCESENPQGQMIPFSPFSFPAGWHMLGYHSTGGARKVRVFYVRKDPQHRLFFAKLSIVAIYALFERPPKSFLRKSSFFGSVFNESQLSFEGLPTKFSLLSESPPSDNFRRAL